jgi:hypothetical protein
MWEHLDFWAMVITLLALAYFTLRDRIVRPIKRAFGGRGDAPASKTTARPLRRRVPIRRVDGKLNGSFSVTNDVTTKVAPPKPSPAAPASDVASSLPVTSLRNDVTWEEAARIGLMLAQKIAPSEIAKALPGYTPGRYKEFKAKVDQVKAALEVEEVIPA